MGCGGSKGKDEAEIDADITFKPVGVVSMDSFFDQAKQLLDNFNGLTGPLQEQKDKFFELTGFYLEPAAGNYHS